MTPNSFRAQRLAVGLCLVAVATGTLASPQVPSTLIDWVRGDLVLHFLAYLMAGLTLLPFVRRPGWAALGLSSLAVAGEVAQGLLTTDRSPQILDAVFGVAGVFTVWVAGESLCWFALWRKRLQKQRRS